MDCEMPTISEQTQRKARKEHECCECHQAIIVRDIYQECKGLWEGSWKTYRWCMPCDEIRQKVFAVLDTGDGIEFGKLLETWKELNL